MFEGKLEEYSNDIVANSSGAFRRGVGSDELLIKEARRASRRRRLCNGLIPLLVLLLVSGDHLSVDRGGPSAPRIGPMRAPLHTSALDPLFSVSRILTLATDGAGPSSWELANHSIFRGRHVRPVKRPNLKQPS